jgi:hypothetical protein
MGHTELRGWSPLPHQNPCCLRGITTEWRVCRKEYFKVKGFEYVEKCISNFFERMQPQKTIPYLILPCMSPASIRVNHCANRCFCRLHIEPQRTEKPVNKANRGKWAGLNLRLKMLDLWDTAQKLIDVSQVLTATIIKTPWPLCSSI